MALTRMTSALDSDAAALVAQLAALGDPGLSSRSVEEARALIELGAERRGPGPDVGSVADCAIDTADGRVGVRVYRPDAPGPLPTVVYLHGGGWVGGSVTWGDGFARRLCATCPCTVVSVEYRLAPEHPFPAGLTDAVESLRWACAHAHDLGGNPSRVVVLGDSAGGNLAAVAVRRLRDAGEPMPARQILAYPVTSTSEERSDGGELWWRYPLSPTDLRWFEELYAPEPSDRNGPDVAPLLAEDVGGLPPATVLLAGCDPLCEEGIRYARHLAQAGVSVDLHVYGGQVHGFLTMGPQVLQRSDEALGVVVTAIRAT